MSYWDATLRRIVSRPDAPYPDYPGWVSVDCGCCNGLEWGGEEPRECRACGGNGSYARHLATGTLALYPGGPLMGHESIPDDGMKESS